MNYDCKVYQYDDKAERWQLRATYADPIAAHVDGDGIAIPASDFDGPAVETANANAAAALAVDRAVKMGHVSPQFGVDNGAWIRVLTEADGGIPVGYEVSLKIDVDAVDMLDSNATAKMADPLRRNEP